jgi:hypothetical protein
MEDPLLLLGGTGRLFSAWGIAVATACSREKGDLTGKEAS